MLKITEAELKQIIKEEAENVKKELLLRKELSKIQKELDELNEVHAGGEMNPGADGVHAGQRKPVFTKKGTHLVEDEDEMSDDAEMTGDTEMSDDTEMTGGDTDGMSMDMDMDSEGENEIEINPEDLKSAIEALGAQLGLTGTVDFDAGAMEDAGLEGGEGEGDSMDVDIETGADDAAGAEEEIDGDMDTDSGEESSEEESEEKEEVDECGDASMEEKSQPMMENTNTPKNKKLMEEMSRWKTLIKYNNPS